MPQSNAKVNPAAVSAVEGSNQLVSDSAKSEPARTVDGAWSVAVGATLVTVTVTDFVDVNPPLSVARAAIVTAVGPSRPDAEKVTICPGVSNVPSLSRSHA